MNKEVSQLKHPAEESIGIEVGAVVSLVETEDGGLEGSDRLLISSILCESLVQVYVPAGHF